MAYCTVAEVREVGVHISATAENTPATDGVLRKIIERASRIFDLECAVEPEYFESAYSPDWQSLHVYIVGDLVRPTTPNSHVYRVTTAGTSGASEPTWPTSSGGTVTNGSAVFTENGPDAVASNKTIYGDGTNYLRLPPYITGTLNTTITLPDGYTAPTFIERDGFLILTTSNGLTPPFSSFYNRSWPGWWSGVPVIVSAVWGFRQTPADVNHAIVEFVINLLKETDPASIRLMSLDNQPLREKSPPRVAMVASKYRGRRAMFV